jgi:hypothetical protein
MADYKEIKGVKIQSILEDPSGTNLYNGRVWFNATSGNLKYRREEIAAVGGTWTSGGNLNVGRRCSGANAGTQTAALAFCGFEGPSGSSSPTSGPTKVTSKATEEYDGSAWTAAPNTSTDRRNAAGAGTQTAGLVFGGNANWPPSSALTSATEEYNGSSWGGGGSMPGAREYLAGCGPQTAALSFGGNLQGSPPNVIQQTNTSNEYNGSSWAAGGTLAGTPTTGALRNNSGAAGTSTAGLAFGGRDGAVRSTQHYDGSSWTVAANMGGPNGAAFVQGIGTQTAALSIGAEPNTTQEYDGTSWVTGVTAPSPNYSGGSAGTTSSAVTYGGSPAITTTLEYTGPITSGLRTGGTKFIS